MFLICETFPLLYVLYVYYNISIIQRKISEPVSTVDTGKYSMLTELDNTS